MNDSMSCSQAVSLFSVRTFSHARMAVEIVLLSMRLRNWGCLWIALAAAIVALGLLFDIFME